MSTTLYFSKRMLRGTLKGMIINDSITHVDREHALRWVQGCKANCKDWEFAREPMVNDCDCSRWTLDSYDCCVNCGRKH